MGKIDEKADSNKQERRKNLLPSISINFMKYKQKFRFYWIEKQKITFYRNNLIKKFFNQLKNFFFAIGTGK